MKKKLLRIFFAFIMFFSVLPTQHIYNNEETPVVAASKPAKKNTTTIKFSTSKVGKWDNTPYNTEIWFWKSGGSGAAYAWDANISVTTGSTYQFLLREKGNWNWQTKNYNTFTIAQSWGGSAVVYVTGTVNSNAGGSSYSVEYSGSAPTYSAKFYANYPTGANTLLHTLSATESNNWASNVPANPSCTGYTFNGWYTAASGGTKLSSSAGASLAIYENLTYYAQWTINKYTITFNSNGGSAVSSITQNYATTVTKPDDPTKTGYTFAGWYSNEGLTNAYTFSTMPASNTTLYAKWTANKYTVSYNGNGATGGSTSESNHTYGTASALTKNGFSLPGYSFAGWNTTADGSGTSYSDQQSVSTLTATNGGSVTLYAQWSANTYTITLDNQGADIASGTTSVQATYNAVLPSITAPQKTGYDFKGYFSVKDSTSNKDKYYNINGTPYSSKKYTLTDDITIYATWQAQTFNINFNINYDGGVNLESITVTYDSYFDLPIPEREGYVFKGWNNDSLGGGSVWLVNGEQVKITQGYTVYAIWVLPIAHNLTLHLNGGLINESTEDVNHTVYETLSYNLPTPIRTGYTFEGWYKTADFQNKVETNDEVPSVGEGNLFTDLYAKWTINQYTISFEENGGSTVDDITQNYATEVTKPTDPTKTGYTFGGWYTNEECTAPFTFTTMPANDVTLYAKWNINQYTIVFNSNGGSSVDSITQDYQSDVVQPADPTRTGYTFSGWFTDNGTFENEFTFDTMPLDGITLYAKWTPINYKITFVENSGSTVSDITQGYETKITKPTDPTKTGYTFGGWFTDNNTFENEFVFDTMPLNGTTLYAKWIAKTYSVTLDKQGGEGGTSSFTATYGIEPSIEIPTREGYKFNGYFTGTNGTGTQMFASTGNGSRNWNIDSDTTLYAKWTANVCNLKFILNYANSPANPNAVDVTYDQIMNLPVPTRTGYTFLGWNTNSSGTGTYYRNGEVCKITAGIDTLYAIWEVKVYNIETNLDGGSILNQNLPSSYTIETESFNLPTPTKDGWTFEGWYDGNNLYKTVSFTQGVTIGDKSYTAIWTQKITIYADMTEALKQNSSYKNPHVYYWNGYGNNTWPGESMTLVEGNLYKLEVVFATSNETAYPKSKLGSIDALIFIFYEGSSLKQTIDIIPDNSITTADNGKEYKFIIPQPNYAEAHNWKIDNIGFAQIITLTYMDGNEIKSSEEITTSDIIQHKFYEKEGYRLEGWYDNPSFTGERHENGITTSVSLTLYAHYVPADDFYLYIDAREVINSTGEGKWTPTYVYLWSQYFGSHDNTWPGDNDANTVVNLGNGMYQIKIDASKSYDHLIINDGINKKTEDIELSPSNVYYIINESHWDVPNGEGVEDDQICFATTEEEHLDNLMGVQKVSGTNNFRFSAALPTGLNIDNNVSKNFGYKFIFIKEDNSSYIGYWSFSTSNKLDALRLDELYKSTALDPESTYDGFYALTLKSSASFDYKDYVRVVVVACYKENNSNNTNVIKAQEYVINVDGDNITLTQVDR